MRQQQVGVTIGGGALGVAWQPSQSTLGRGGLGVSMVMRVVVRFGARGEGVVLGATWHGSGALR